MARPLTKREAVHALILDLKRAVSYLEASAQDGPSPVAVALAAQFRATIIKVARAP